MGESGMKIDMTPSHPGSFIRVEILEELGLSVARGAEILGVSQSALSARRHSAAHSDDCAMIRGIMPAARVAGFVDIIDANALQKCGYFPFHALNIALFRVRSFPRARIDHQIRIIYFHSCPKTLLYDRFIPESEPYVVSPLFFQFSVQNHMQGRLKRHRVT